MSTTEQDVRGAIRSASEAGDGPNPWPERLQTFKKFADRFHTTGEKIERRYEDERDAAEMSGQTYNDAGMCKVNMFYSNTTIIKESLYNSLPKPSVSRLQGGDWDNDIARVAAMIVERGLTYEVKNAPWFDEAIKSAILDRLVPGLGTVWLSFDPAQAPEMGKDGLMQGVTKPEQVTVDFVYWKDLKWDPQRHWEQCTWVARKLTMSPEEAKKRFGDAARLLTPNKMASSVTESEQAICAGKVEVLQVWDKTTRTVIHMTCEGQILKTDPDPYKLKNFFPTPKPLISSPPTRKFLPLADYYMAQDQYLAMDVLYARINLIIKAIRVAGVYDAANPEIGRMLNGGENQLIPVDNWAMFAETGGAKGKIDWYPVETVATVLGHLVNTFGFIKTQLYEVTGMSDIIRGSSNQYETLGAQQLKAQFASVRLNAFQRDVAFFVRDTVRIIAELQTQLYSPQRLQVICGNFTPEDKVLLEPAYNMLQQDFLSSCNIDIEADSLTQADWGQEQGQRQAYAQSLSQFLTGALPVAQEVPALAPLMIAIVKFLSVGFKGASELEGVLDKAMDQMQQLASQPKPPSPEDKKAQIEQQKVQQDMQIKQQEFQMDTEQRQQELQFKEREHIQDMQFAQQKHDQEMAFMREKAALQAQVDITKANIQAQSAAVKADQQAQIGENKVKESENAE